MTPSEPEISMKIFEEVDPLMVFNANVRERQVLPSQRPAPSRGTPPACLTASWSRSITTHRYTRERERRSLPHAGPPAFR